MQDFGWYFVLMAISTYSISVPGVHNVPSIPSVPGIPNVPSVPSVPGISNVLDVPCLPGVHNVPSVPGVPSVPFFPSVPIALTRTWSSVCNMHNCHFPYLV